MRRLIAVCLLCLMVAIPLHAQYDGYAEALRRIEGACERDAESLILGGLSLTEVPAEIGQLTNLRWLDLSGNQLATIPSEIGQLSQLQVLWLSTNHLTTLPPEIGQLNRLCFLDLQGNNLRHLPTSIGNLNSLTQQNGCFRGSYGIYLDGNPLISPPPEVVEQGTAAVLAYLRNQAWYHAQRLIIGVAAGVGLLALLVLGVRWKQRGGRKPKREIVA